MSSTFSLETERLLLRVAEPGDVEGFVRLHDDALVARYMGVRDREWYEWRLGVSAEEWAGDAALGRRAARGPLLHAMIRPDNVVSIAVASASG
ncbi:MAG TPA: hypothetical protein VKB23_08205 [Solirubrobacterales bacterium]|nr:hypothetical protein [Solirubrobacterales bacterium]